MAKFTMTSEYLDEKGSTSFLNPSKLEEGSYKLRILSQPVEGWEEWHLKKPYRYTLDRKPDAPIDDEGDIKFFSSMIVWNYTAKAIQILHVVQVTIRKALLKLAADPDWGAPFEYDIKLCKEGSGKETEYSVMAMPRSPTSQSIIDAFHAKPINLNALFAGKDPFNSDRAPTPLGISESEERIVPAIQLNEPEDELDFETFADYLPIPIANNPDIETFIAACAKASNMSPEAYMLKTLDNLDVFATGFSKWLDRKKPAAKAV